MTTRKMARQQRRSPTRCIARRRFDFNQKREIRRDRSGRRSSPWSTPRRSLSRTSPSSPRMHRLPRTRGAASANRRSGRRGCRSTSTALVLRSRPSYTPSEPAGCHSVLMSSRLTKKSLVSVSGLLGEDAVLGAAGIGAEHAQAADEHRHLGRRQRQQLRPIHQRLLRHHELLLAADIVAEAVGARFERREGVRRRSAPATRPCGRA